MDWIIRKSKRLSYHNNLHELLAPILSDVKSFNWLVTDLDYVGLQASAKVDLDHDYFILTSKEFCELIEANAQIIWGVFLGIPDGIDIKIDTHNLPFAEFNDAIWLNGNIQHPKATVEIVCFDSSYTIVKFKEQKLSDKFKAYFNEAIKLETFKQA